MLSEQDIEEGVDVICESKYYCIQVPYHFFISYSSEVDNTFSLATPMLQSQVSAAPWPLWTPPFILASNSPSILAL